MADVAGRLLAVEGGEGVGKSTQAARLAEALGADLTREPGGTPLGEQIRAVLLEPGAGPLGDRTELLLMVAARAQHMSERIAPALSGGRDVVVDRFSGSTLAYQGYGRGIPLEEVRAACSIASNGRWPDLNILLDAPLEIASARRATLPDRIEAEASAFHERVRQGFLAEAAADQDHWCVIDATAPLEEVTRSLLAAVGERLGTAGEVR